MHALSPVNRAEKGNNDGEVHAHFPLRVLRELEAGVGERLYSQGAAAERGEVPAMRQQAGVRSHTRGDYSQRLRRLPTP